jgi:alkyldihydroxyacetonephosphate synthase
MSLSREAIVEGLRHIVGPDNVVTDERVLLESSVDNFRKLQNIFDVHTMPVPAAVVMPGGAEEVSELLMWADRNAVNVIPRTGGTATEGGLESVVPDSVIIDGGRMDRIISVDAYNMQATAQCGVPLQELEDKARELGLTTGHSPQSKPVAHLGGLVATRSIGQFSTLYGGIEDMVVGLEAVFPNGRICRIKNVPRRAAGPDIRHVVIGNEGALCFITEVTVKLFPYFPQNNRFLGWTLKDMATGFAVLREVMVNGYKPSVARVYDPGDAGIHFSHFAEPDDCVLLFMAEGAAGIANATADGIQEIVDRHPECAQVDSRYIETWFNDLCWDASKITAEDERIRQTRNVNRTTEISADWSSINDIYQTAKARIIDEIPDITMMGGHSSHSYINGTNMYFNYFFNVVGVGPEEETDKYYLPIIGIICEETLKRGGSIVHHHGMGKARAPWVRDEYGSSYYMLETMKHAFDPNGIMNVGTIIPLEK